MNDVFLDVATRSFESEGTDIKGNTNLPNLSSMQIGNGSQVFRGDQSGIWLGAEEFADAPFSVDMEGNVTATSLTASGFIQVGGAASDINSGTTTVNGGKLTAGTVQADTVVASISITTPTINGGTITIGSGNNVFKVNSSGLSLGHATFGSAPFRVTMAGAVTASSITLTNASVGSGSTYTGNQINETYLGNISANKIVAASLSAISANLGNVTVGGSADTLGTISVRNASNVEISKLNNNGIIIRNTRGLFFEETVAGRYWDLSVNNANQSVMSLSSTNQFFIKNFAGDSNLFTVSDTAVYCKRELLLDEGVTFSDPDQYIDDDGDNDLRLHFRENAEFYKNGTLKAIIDSNIYTAGDLIADGSKPFLIPHPDGSDRMLRYTAQESPDVCLRYRGVVDIDGHGEAEIIPPQHFILVTEPKGLVTVNLTPMDKGQFWVKHIEDNKKVVLCGPPKSQAMFEVIAIRKGFLNHPVELGNDTELVQRLSLLKGKHIKEDFKTDSEKFSLMEAKRNSKPRWYSNPKDRVQ